MARKPEEGWDVGSKATIPVEDWNSDIRIKGSYGAANRFTVVMWMN